MRDESTRQAAQEFLAAKLTEEAQRLEDKLNQETAVARSLQVWKHFRDSIFSQCNEWNSVTQEQTLTCKETPLGDLRVWCAGHIKTSDRALRFQEAASHAQKWRPSRE